MSLVRAQNGILKANSALTCKQIKHFDWSIYDLQAAELKFGLTNKALWLDNLCSTVCKTMSCMDTTYKSPNSNN